MSDNQTQKENTGQKLSLKQQCAKSASTCLECGRLGRGQRRSCEFVTSYSNARRKALRFRPRGNREGTRNESMLKCGRNEGGLTDQILSYKFPSSASTDTSLSWSKDAPIPVECARGIPDVAQPRWFSDLSNPFSLVTPDRGSVV